MHEQLLEMRLQRSFDLLDLRPDLTALAQLNQNILDISYGMSIVSR
jgi:hypothetical protein